MDDLEHILSCSICMEIYQSPRQLPCQHTYCTSCLGNIITKNKKGSIRTGFHIYCPLCRGKIDLGKTTPEATNFPLSLTIQSLLGCKELMMTLKQSQEAAAKSTTAIQDMFSVESRTTPTDKLNRKKKSTGIQTDKLPEHNQWLLETAQLAAESTHDMQAELLTFHNISIFNVYKPLFNFFFEPLLTERCSVMRTKATIAFAGPIVLIYFLSVAEDLTEGKYLYLLVSTLALLLQVLFIRIKLNSTRYTLKRYIYAFIGYMVLHLFTVLAFELVFIIYTTHLSNFIMILKNVNFTVTIPNGCQYETLISSGDTDFKEVVYDAYVKGVTENYLQYLALQTENFIINFLNVLKYIALQINAFIIYLLQFVAAAYF